MAKKTQKPRTEYLVVVTYAAKFYFDYSLENPDGPEVVIEKYLKKKSGGSGMGFGGRDLSFYFRSKKEAEAVKDKIAKAPFKRKWRVKVSEVYSSKD